MNVDENFLYLRLLARLRKAFPVGSSGTATWVAISDKPVFSPVATSGAYSDLSGRPTPFSGAYADLTGLPGLFDGKYASLTGKPALFDGTWASLSGKPALFSGAYADLTGKPVLFDGTWTSLAGKPTFFSGAYGDLTGKPVLFDGTWDSLANKPATFATTWTLVSGKPTLFDGTWASLSGKPSLFSGTYADLTGKPQLPRAIRAQTSTAGVYNWTFSDPFPTGVIPVVTATVEDGTLGPVFGVTTFPATNIGVKIQVSKSVGVSVAGISVLGAAVGVQVYVNIQAVAPT